MMMFKFHVQFKTERAVAVGCSEFVSPLHRPPPSSIGSQGTAPSGSQTTNERRSHAPNEIRLACELVRRRERQMQTGLRRRRLQRKASGRKACRGHENWDASETPDYASECP